MKSSKNKATFLEIVKIIFKRVRLSTLILLVITLSSTTFAWFIYSTKVSAGITAHIEAWDILFTSSEDIVEEYVNFVIPEIYPGMDDYTDHVTAYNRGEKNATITYEVVSVRILNNTLVADGTAITSQMLINKLVNDYPFEITFNLTNEQLDASTGIATFSINAEWPYESGNDSLDTYWGQQSYTYHSNFPNSPSIEIQMKITAVQNTT